MRDEGDQAFKLTVRPLLLTRKELAKRSAGSSKNKQENEQEKLCPFTVHYSQARPDGGRRRALGGAITLRNKGVGGEEEEGGGAGASNLSLGRLARRATGLPDFVLGLKCTVSAGGSADFSKFVCVEKTDVGAISLQLVPTRRKELRDQKISSE